MVCYFLAIYLENGYRLFFNTDIATRERYFSLESSILYNFLIPLCIAFLWSCLFFWQGLYKSFLQIRIRDILLITLKASIVGMIILCGASFFSGNATIFGNPFIFLSFFVTTVFFVSFEKIVCVLAFHYFKLKDHRLRNILIVGTGCRALTYIKELHKNKVSEFKLVGLVDISPSRLGKIIDGEKVIGLLNDIPRLICEKIVDEVIFVVPRKWLPKIEDAIIACETQGVKTAVAADFFNTRIAKSSFTMFGNVPILEFPTTKELYWRLFLKRCLDVVLSSLLLFLLSPLIGVTAVLIKYTSPGPAFYTQERMGRNGRIFRMYKFRSMVVEAENVQDKLKHLNIMDGPVFKIKDDPRITIIGKFIRKISIDELPQLLNVLHGDMSLVGPRPPVPKEVNMYDQWHRRRLSVPPGITCIWQISGRNKIKFEDWIKLDLEYIDNWSLWLDIKILAKTIPTVIFCIGAH